MRLVTYTPGPRRVGARLGALSAVVIAAVSCGNFSSPAPPGSGAAGSGGSAGAALPGGAAGSIASGGASGGAGGAGGLLGGAAGSAGTGGGAVSAPTCAATTGTTDGELTVRRPELGARRLGGLSAGDVVRIDSDPLTGDLVYMNRGGDFHRLDPATGASTPTETDYPGEGDHRGMAYGPDGALYVMTAGGENISATIRKGVPNGGARTWTILATTAGYPAGGTNFDHSYAGLLVSADNQWLYVASGSRTDHGETEAGQREVALTSAIFRLPTSGANLSLANDEAALKTAGYLFADGLRNPFDLAFNHLGELFAVDNGPDMDLPDELNWVQEGMHYGFPWRFGGEPNPVLDPAYTPDGDMRLHGGFQAVDNDTYVHDPAFPAAPAQMVDAIKNTGPDADKLRPGPASAVMDASDTGTPLRGITGHRSPLGLSFDAESVLCGDYYQSGFMLSFGAFLDVLQDRGEDLLLVQLTKVGAEYEMTTTQLVTGFSAPIDGVLVGNKLYVVEFGEGASAYEITFPLPAP